jgi:hypothetical protein
MRHSLESHCELVARTAFFGPRFVEDKPQTPNPWSALPQPLRLHLHWLAEGPWELLVMRGSAVAGTSVQAYDAERRNRKQ